jgi:PhnB protein
MAKMNSYLNFNGNTEEAFNFYKSVFGGDFLTLMRYKDMPDAEKTPADELEKVMHVALSIGDNILMGTDVLKSMEPVNFGTNSSISIDGESEEEANQLFNKLSAGGKVVMPLEKMFWGALFGMITDKFGVQWMVNYDFKERNTVL